MPEVSPARIATPIYPEDQGNCVETVTVANGDTLVLTGANRESAHRFIKVAPSASTSALVAISDGAFPGQQVTFFTATATNVFRVPTSLSNVTLAANVDVDDEAPKTLVWDGSKWFLAA